MKDPIETMGRARAVLIAGPTASGKSAFALAIARACRGVIVNADSMQIYREMRVLSARPSAEEEAGIEHRLYGHVSVREPYSVGRWRDEAEAVLAELRARDVPAIVVGGTGLYFKALSEGLSPVPPVDEAVRAHWRGLAGEVGAAALHAELEKRDPVMAAALEPTDAQRILRALEVVESTGRSLADWQAQVGAPLVGDDALRLVIAPERAWLHARINARFEAMVAEGGLEEARALAQMKLDPAMPAWKAIGVRPLAEAAMGERDLSEAIERAKTDTRRYAKRQETWFRNQMGDWPRVTPAEVEETAARVATALGGAGR
ncbi:tRNA (adenosine(37)-N6)-dimethylallyltransferase MiaA [Breoghania sp.]|uniref:tRNA (adenosine(37)-N6)-dimethylallyltransferase MiaA n=1 Tax=Breoghania sp. TaxID=2065378 RepID=UPI002AABA512|nr:tRNA (adenosine(37)-N6)-dimethylallyltransferase MiaA [Breoghania sp.]